MKKRGGVSAAGNEYSFGGNFTYIVGFDEFTVALLINVRAHPDGAPTPRG
jgi:hypothetical protein